MSVSTEDPAERSLFETREGDEITDFLREQYVDNDISFDAAGRQPRFRAATTATPRLAGDHIRSSIDYRGTCDPFDYYLFYFCRHGRMRVDTVDSEQRMHVGDATLFPPGRRLDFDFREVGLQVLRLPPGRLEAIAEGLTGVPAAEVRFDGVAPVSALAHRRWNDTFNFVSKTLTGESEPPASTIVIEQLTQLLVATALTTFANTTMDRRPGDGGMRPAALRRAMDYIDSHADRPVTLADIGAAAGTTGRAIQYAFRKYEDTTPLGYLRRVRLEHAHHDLHHADPRRGDTVTAIAARWGFVDVGHFATSYRSAYGEPPSRSLRR